MLTIALLAILWVACGIAAAGFAFASSVRQFPLTAPRRSDLWREDCLFWLPNGPFYLAGVLLTGGCRHGWLWPWSKV